MRFSASGRVGVVRDSARTAARAIAPAAGVRRRGRRGRRRVHPAATRHVALKALHGVCNPSAIPPSCNPASTSSRRMVSSRSEPVETIAADAGHFFEPRDVAPRRLGQILVPPHASGRRRPARHRFVHRLARASCATSDGNSVSVRLPQRVRRADLDALEAVEHVELGQRQRVEAVDADAVAHGDRVVPAAAPRPAGDRAVLVAAVAQPVAHLAGRARSAAAPRRRGSCTP